MMKHMISFISLNKLNVPMISWLFILHRQHRCSLEGLFRIQFEESHRLGNIDVDFILWYS